MREPRRCHRTLAVAAGALAMLAAVAGEPTPTRRGEAGRAAHPGLDVVPALQLAHWIREAETKLRIVDLRGRDQFEEYHLPGAEHLSAWPEPARIADSGATVVLYTDGSSDVAEHEQARRAMRDLELRHAALLDGGILAWIATIESPRLAPLPPAASPADSAARAEHLALSRWFGGTPVVDPALAADTVARSSQASAHALERDIPSRPADAGEPARAVRRRGC